LEFSVTGHIRIINDPVELVPLLITFNDEKYKQIYELLNRAWMTEAELAAEIGGDHVDDCITILKKGNLIEEQWRMPEPGKNPEKEFRATYSKFRANFQCGMSELADLLYISISNDESLRTTVEAVEAELANGNISINDLARKYSVSPFFIRGIAKRSQRMDVRGQGLVFLDRAR
jgi:predicted DNA-binding ArsR family transcriptional regulator